jgi:hypothetical protein
MQANCKGDTGMANPNEKRKDFDQQEFEEETEATVMMVFCWLLWGMVILWMIGTFMR